ncbi:caspase family protein [Sodalinema gerasimenkoae]|uniref:caspase family protein n=1 Tax=Sodalinema gerasimenkoae TaxID=2862348 RepID=UPI001358785A|nr:caspase family protein [Sodalinema gerasimenkoae]
MNFISRILVVDSEREWYEALSKAFKLENLFNRFKYIIDYVDSCESAKKHLDDNEYDMVIVTENLETTSGYLTYEGLYVLDYINKKHSYIYKILINTCELEPKEKHYDIFDKYRVDNPEVFVKQRVNTKDFTNTVIEMVKKFQHGYALLIGVGYENSLPATVNDAKDIYGVLVDSRLAAYPQQQVQLLTEEASTKANILAELDTLANQVRGNPEATVWIYYSGHGFFSEQTQEYFLIPYDYSLREIEDTSISSQEWSIKIEEIKAKKLIVWLDCCHAGGMLSKELDGLPFCESPPPKGIFKGLNSGSGRVVVASCKQNQKSYILDGAVNSVFTTCLLEVLQGQGLTDFDDEYIRFFQIMSYLYHKVPESVKTKPQNPILVSGEGIDEDFAVCCRPRKKVAISQPTYPAEQIDEIREADIDQSNENVTPAFIENLQNKIKGNYKVLKILNQQIADFEIEEITTANPSLKFELNQKIPGLKERSAALENEIEDLNNRLYQARENFD